MTRLHAFTSSQMGAFEESECKARNNLRLSDCGFMPPAFGQVMQVGTLGPVQITWEPGYDYGQGMAGLMACIGAACDDHDPPLQCCFYGESVMADAGAKIEGQSYTARCKTEGWGACSADSTWCEYESHHHETGMISTCTVYEDPPMYPFTVVYYWNMGKGPPWAPGDPTVHRTVTGAVGSYGSGGDTAQVFGSIVFHYYVEAYVDGEQTGYSPMDVTASCGATFPHPTGQVWDGDELRQTLEAATLLGGFNPHAGQDPCLYGIDYCFVTSIGIPMGVAWQ